MSALRQCEHCGSVEKVHDRDSCDYLRSKLSADEVESLLDVLPYSSIPTTWYVATAVRWFLDHGWNQPIRDAAASEGNDLERLVNRCSQWVWSDAEEPDALCLGCREYLGDTMDFEDALEIDAAQRAHLANVIEREYVAARVAEQTARLARIEALACWFESVEDPSVAVLIREALDGGDRGDVQ